MGGVQGVGSVAVGPEHAPVSGSGQPFCAEHQWDDLEAVVRHLHEVGVVPIDNPFEAFATLAEEAVALKTALAERVATLTTIRAALACAALLAAVRQER